MSQHFIGIEIDLEVYKAIEVKRSSFAQKQNDILRELLDLHPAWAPVERTLFQKEEGTTRKRITGDYDFLLFGTRHHSSSLKDSYLKCLVELGQQESGFFEKLSKVEISAARRIIAKEPEELFIKSPHLAKDYAERLNDKWWVDINISQQQVETRIKDACKIVGLKFGVDLRLEFPAE